MNLIQKDQKYKKYINIYLESRYIYIYEYIIFIRGYWSSNNYYNNLSHCITKCYV